jgi:hypothetical protein
MLPSLSYEYLSVRIKVKLGRHYSELAYGNLKEHRLIPALIEFY